MELEICGIHPQAILGTVRSKTDEGLSALCFAAIICLYPFSHQKKHFSQVPMRFLTYSHIHILFVFLIKKTPKKGYTRNQPILFSMIPKI